MGVVFHGFDPVIGRDVAVKTLHLSEAGTGMSREELVGRFQTEARAAGLLTHPNIVVVFDAGEEDGLFYITMEFVEGRSLQTLIDAHQLFPLARVMKLMEQVCSALDFAHQHNVVHRDIKPANLMLAADDTVKITDFGTAKILQFGTAQTAHVMGTPSYMSPEQVKGKPVDGRSDIFSLGVILYELMTGEKPFPGQNITTVIYKIINEEPIPPRQLDSSIHPGLSAVISRALAKDPAARFQSCHELLNALRNHHEMTGPEATVRMAPVHSQTAAAGNRAGAPQARPIAVAPFPKAGDEDQPLTLPVAPLPVGNYEETPKKSGSLLLTLILLGIIGYSAYRVYPPLVDLWQRAREPVEAEVFRSKRTPAQTPNLDDATARPGAQADNSSQAAAPTPNTAPAPEENPAPEAQPQPAAASAIPVKTSDLPPAPINSVEKSVAPQKPAASAAPSAVHLLESKLRSELAGSALADKVQFQATANVLTLSGSLTFAEHRDLLEHLHTVPSGVRVIDDIEYTDAENAPSAPASVGWVWVRSTPLGARILIDGVETGLRTPARVELQEGEHQVSLARRGFARTNRAVIVHPGQTMQFTELLAAE